MAEEPDRGLPVIKLAIVVEGRTEVTFVKEVLANHLRLFGIDPVNPIPIGRSRRGIGGGDVSAEKLVSDMVRLRGSYDAVMSYCSVYF